MDEQRDGAELLHRAVQKAFPAAGLREVGGQEIDPVPGRRRHHVTAKNSGALGEKGLGDAAADAAGAAGDQGALALQKFHAHGRHASRGAMAAKTRLDVALVERGLAETRAAAQRLVMAGLVFSGERRLEKAGQGVAPDTALEVRGQPHPYVSRGGLKLAKALDHFALPVAGRIALDVGASTGGFTDCLLQRGAARVYAVDVGTNQLAWKLRSDPRVVSIEKTNMRDVKRALIPEPVELIVCDASFIGLRTVLPAALALAAPGAHLAALIKPQFEVGKGRVGKGGIVREPALHVEVCGTVSDWLGAQPGWRVLGVVESPITGAEGNKEFLISAQLSS